MRALVLALTTALAACGTDLPEHDVKESELVDGQRIQIDVAADISREECVALIVQNQEKAKPNGQVSVHKFNKAFGRPAPWCVENFDGRGVTFNEYGF